MGCCCCKSWCNGKDKKDWKQRHSGKEEMVMKKGSDTLSLEEDIKRGTVFQIPFATSDVSPKKSSEPTEISQTSVRSPEERPDQVFRGGPKSGYSSQKSVGRKKDRSERSSSIDEQSHEFQLMKRWLKTKDYDVEKTIGAGNYAVVYKATYRPLNKKVAVKVVNLKKSDEDYRKNFLPNELMIMKKCRNYNLVKTYQFFQLQNRVIMVMEFAANGNLAERLQKKGVLNEVLAHMMFTQIIDGLHCLHSNRIAHRDLKLENILLTYKDDPKITDFSYSIKLSSEDQLCSSYCGSLPYFSPEILMRVPHKPMLSDIWSLGVCFYIMLNDCLPFKIGNDRKMLSKQLEKEWKFRQNIDTQLSKDLKSMIRRMLEPDVDLRATINQLKEDEWVNNY